MPDAQLFRAENELEQALAAAFAAGNRDALLAAVARHLLYVPTRAQTAEDGRLELAALERGGRQYVAAYSSLGRLERSRPEGGGYVALTGQALASAWPKGFRLALNPDAQPGTVLDEGEIGRLEGAGGRAEDGFAFGEPAVETPGLLEAIRGFAAKRPEIRAAHRGLLVHSPGVPEPIVALVLEPEADRDAVIRGASEAVREAGVETLALVPVVEGEDGGPLVELMLERTDPFYVRGT
jgi:SseB protein C-terminal domain/SseB protein N-terminal domain